MLQKSSRSKKLQPVYKDDYILQELKKGREYNEIVEYFNNHSKEGMWQKLNKLIKPNVAIVLFGSEPFSSALRMRNIKNYKYDWVWDKHIPRNFINAKIMPMQKHENISIFGSGKINYYPVKIKRDKPVIVKNYSKKDSGSAYKLNEEGSCKASYTYTHRHPDTIIEGFWEANKGKVHPTQKPVALLEYLIKTYTNEGDLVLDFTMGSGTTGVACKNLNRDFIGIELDEKYYNIAKKRICGGEE